MPLVFDGEIGGKKMGPQEPTELYTELSMMLQKTGIVVVTGLKVTSVENYTSTQSCYFCKSVEKKF